MANYIPLNTLQLPGLSSTYYVPQVINNMNIELGSSMAYSAQEYVPSFNAVQNWVPPRASQASYANVANKLATNCALSVNLSYTSLEGTNFNGSSGVILGISGGILGVGFGGTGYSGIGSGSGVSHDTLKYRASALNATTASVPTTNGTIMWAYA